MDFTGKPLAFIDIETTGFSPLKDKMIEIAIIRYNGEESRYWSHLINPEVMVPASVSQLTGITPAMLANMPTFDEIAQDIASQVSGHLIVAHNARFDCAFLKRAFLNCGLVVPLPAICTVKLSRALFPLETRHDLDSLIARNCMKHARRHRALGDAEVLLHFWKTIVENLPENVLRHALSQQLSHPTIPPHLAPELFDTVPESCGVYLFMGADGIPLYVGKSRNLRKRILSHFSADAREDRALRMTQQIRGLEFFPCRSEMEALLLEAQKVKQLLPVFNRQLRSRKKLYSWYWPDSSLAETPLLKLLNADELLPGVQASLYGVFRNTEDAKRTMEAIVVSQQLCPVVTGLQKGSPGRPCFSYQIKRCLGACCGKESREAHHGRLREALAKFRLQRWVWSGPVILEDEGCIHVLDAWCYLGTLDADSPEHEIKRLIDAAKPLFDQDIYRIVAKHSGRFRPVSSAGQRRSGQ